MAGVYVHIPFRQNARRYDDSYTVSHSPSGELEFVEAVCQEGHEYADLIVTDHPVTTLYLGGGRPSLLSLEALHRLFGGLRDLVDPSALEETTMEMNPIDASDEYLRGLHNLGVSRLSIEAVALTPDGPTALDAPHSVEDTRGTIDRAKSIGFESTSVDLVFGGLEPPLPQWKTSLERTIALDIPHVALHELSPPNNADAHETKRADRLAVALRFLEQEGYAPYELTHLARPGHPSRHQSNYYAHGNYLGLGPSAESFWWPNRSENTTARRWSNVADVTRYVEGGHGNEPHLARDDRLGRDALAREYILLRLRTSEGLNLRVLEERYGVSLQDKHGSVLDRLEQEGLIHDEPERVRLTNRGRLLADAITERLLRPQS